MGDLSSRRGMVQGMDDMVGGKAIKAEVPLSEMFGYATQLRSMTQGRDLHDGIQALRGKHRATCPRPSSPHAPGGVFGMKMAARLSR